DPRRRGRAPRRDGHHGRRLRRVLRAAEGRGQARQDAPGRGGPRVQAFVAHHRRRRHRHDHRRPGPVPPGRRLGARVRPDPWSRDGAGHVRRVLLQAAHRLPDLSEPLPDLAPGDGAAQRRGGRAGSGGGWRAMRIKEAIATFRGHRVPNMNLSGRRNVWFALSGTFIVLSLVGLFARGLNFSIEFKGGSQLQFENRSGVAVKTFQAIMAKYGLPVVRVEIVGGRSCPSGCVQIRAKSLTELGLTPAASPSPTPTTSASASASASASPSPTASASASPTPAPSPTQTVLPTLKGDQLRAELAQAAGISPNDINEQDVGPTFGGTISQKMFTGLIVFLVLVSLYISLRFEWKMAVSALIALAHDLIITAGIYALVGREVTPETV